MSGRIRLHVHLARSGVASRRGAERLIDEGRVRVNGEIVRARGLTIDPSCDRVDLDGRWVSPGSERKRYFLFHKPRGVVTTLSDPHAARTLQDFFRDIPERLFPCGRLDKNSTGLVLMTNDGDLVHRLTHPRYGVERRYRVAVKGALPDAALERLRKGIVLEGRRTAPCGVTVLSRAGGRVELEMGLREGRKREIREMVKAVGAEVASLHRIRYGPLELGSLPPGERRELTPAEQALLKRRVMAERRASGKAGISSRT
jgi:pseudouridine synthase